MSSMPALIDFLLGLMRSDDEKTAFEQDPEGTLAANKLQGVTSQDVRDARLTMRDDGAIRPHGTDAPVKHDDPVREIRHTTQNFEVDKNYTINNVDQTVNLFNIEDSFNSNDNNDIRTVAIQDNDTINDNDITIEDSPNKGPQDTPETEDPIVKVDPVEDAPGDLPFGSEPLPDDPIIRIDPIEQVPGDVEIPTEPLPDDQIVSIDPVEETPVHEPIEDEPELAHTDAAIV
jgi:hypothetical protein